MVSVLMNKEEAVWRFTGVCACGHVAISAMPVRCDTFEMGVVFKWTSGTAEMKCCHIVQSGQNLLSKTDLLHALERSSTD